MTNNLVSINDLPPAGKEFFLDDQVIWLNPLKEFKMDCKIEKPIAMKVFIMPAENGVLVRGDISGAVVLPCNRCAEDAHVDLNSHFDEFEEVPEASLKNPSPEEEHVVFERNSPMLNLDEVAWEQFMLALPTRPLCTENCKGLCSVCGTNLNQGSCECTRSEGDPRMAALRGLKIDKKTNA